MTTPLASLSVEQLGSHIDGECEAFVQYSLRNDVDGANVSRTAAHEYIAELSRRALLHDELVKAVEWALTPPRYFDAQKKWIDTDEGDMDSDYIDQTEDESPADFLLRSYRLSQQAKSK